MGKVHLNKKKNTDSKISAIFEQVKRKNIMDWGELEFAEGLLKDKYQR